MPAHRPRRSRRSAWRGCARRASTRSGSHGWARASARRPAITTASRDRRFWWSSTTRRTGPITSTRCGATSRGTLAATCSRSTTARHTEYTDSTDQAGGGLRRQRRQLSGPGQAQHDVEADTSLAFNTESETGRRCPAPRTPEQPFHCHLLHISRVSSLLTLGQEPNMTRAALTFILIALTAGPALAQGRGKNKQNVPPGHLPPAGLCRVWYDGVPPGHQPAPTNCT